MRNPAQLGPAAFGVLYSRCKLLDADHRIIGKIRLHYSDDQKIGAMGLYYSHHPMVGVIQLGPAALNILYCWAGSIRKPIMPGQAAFGILFRPGPAALGILYSWGQLY